MEAVAARLPAAARRARDGDAPVDGRRHAGAGRPARRCRRGGERFLRFLREVARRVHAEDADGPRRGRRARARRRAAPRGRRLRAGGRRVRAPRRATCSARFARCDAARRAVDLGRHARGAAAARDRRRAAAAARDRHRVARAPLRRLERRLLAARVRLRARPRARLARARRARLLRRPDRRARRRRARPPRAGRAPAGRASPCRSTGRRSQLVWDDARLPGRPGLPRLPRAAPSTTCGRGTTAASPTTTTRRCALAREHARDFVERAIARARRYRAERGRPGLVVLRARHRAARPLVVRGPDVARGGARGGASARARAGDAAGGARAPRAGRARARARRRWGAGKDLRTWDSPAVAELAFGRARRRAAHGRRPRRGADGAAARRAGARRARAAGAPVERLGVHGHARAGGRLPAASGCAATRAASATPRWPL